VDVTVTGEGLQNLGLCSGAQGPWAGRDFSRATFAVTLGLDFSGLIRRTAHSVAFYDTQVDV
jgi:hypothetical protein